MKLGTSPWGILVPSFMTHWKVRLPGRHAIGPLSTELLIRGIKSGRIPFDAEVREIGGEAWGPLASVDDFYDAMGLNDAETSVVQGRGPPSSAKRERHEGTGQELDAGSSDATPDTKRSEQLGGQSAIEHRTEQQKRPTRTTKTPKTNPRSGGQGASVRIWDTGNKVPDQPMLTLDLDPPLVRNTREPGTLSQLTDRRDVRQGHQPRLPSRILSDSASSEAFNGVNASGSVASDSANRMAGLLVSTEPVRSSVALGSLLVAARSGASHQPQPSPVTQCCTANECAGVKGDETSNLPLSIHLLDAADDDEDMGSLGSKAREQFPGIQPLVSSAELRALLAPQHTSTATSAPAELSPGGPQDSLENSDEQTAPARRLQVAHTRARAALMLAMGALVAVSLLLIVLLLLTRCLGR